MRFSSLQSYLGEAGEGGGVAVVVVGENVLENEPLGGDDQRIFRVAFGFVGDRGNRPQRHRRHQTDRHVRHVGVQLEA
jgi:hypothetical protein